MAKSETGMNSTPTNLGSLFDPVQSAIHDVEKRMLEQADGNRTELSAALQHLLASGGKRIRVAVTLLMGRLLQTSYGIDDPTGIFNSRLVTLAAAIEMLHTATLVHDDLIDGALVRRGIPTLNAQWTPAATVLTGDFIFARAARLAAETDSVTIMRLFADTLATIVGGEIRQLFGRRISASRDDYERRIYAKTASLFETAALATTSLIMENPEKISPSGIDIKSLESMTQKFGYHLGMAFQVVDDVLDFTGEQATVGKPVASDLRQGLFTLPAIIYLEHNPDDPDLNGMMEGLPLTEINFDRLLGNIRNRDLGNNGSAVSMALQEAQSYVAEAGRLISPLPDYPEKRSLIDLANYITLRKT